MRTGTQVSGPAGFSEFHVGPWFVEVAWTVVAGRVEATRLTMDSDGDAPLTSSAVREVEKAVRDRRTRRAGEIRKAAQDPGETGRRAARQVAAYEAEGQRSHRDNGVWMRRAQTMRDAWANEEPMAAALEAAEPGYSPTTYRTWMTRARAWDRETGAGLLDGVGRPRQRGSR